MVHTLNDFKFVRIMNAGLAVVSAVFGGIGLFAPELLLQGEPVGSPVYAQIYAVRAFVVTGLVVAMMVRPTRVGAVSALVVAGAIQVGDVAIALAASNVGMAVSAVGLAAVHLGSAYRILRATEPVTA